MDAAVLDATVLDAAVLDALVLDVSILDVVNTPYEGDFGCYLEVMNIGCCGFGRWRKLDATLLDALIATRSCAPP